MRFHEFKADGSTLAVRRINRYADEIGKDSMDYDMFKKSAELLDKQMLKSLAKHIEDSDTAPREYVMKTIADHDPETFKKMYGDQEGYMSIMKPMTNLTDDEIEEGADFYGYYKDPKDPEGKTMTYPDDMEFKTPHRSNANARMFLSRIGLDPDFENTGSTPIDDFLKATDKYLRMNVSDKDNPYYDEVEMYDQEARRFKKEYPQITHVGFN
tara:strand:+ start:3296 stop:3931 length:636 start_codon:yes stop_codon:yes gene_type:complete